MSRRSRRYQLTALAYDKRGNLLAIGNNSYTRTHPVQWVYSCKVGKPAGIYIHAELDALLKAKNRGKVHRLVVTRFGKNGQPLPAAPCPACRLAIKDFGVKVVEHT